MLAPSCPTNDRPVCLAILTLPEDAAVLGVSEGSPEAGAVGGGDGGLQLRPLAALHQVQLLALLQLVLLQWHWH